MKREMILLFIVAALVLTWPMTLAAIIGFIIGGLKGAAIGSVMGFGWIILMS